MSEMPEGGRWHNWCYEPPPHDATSVEAWREEWERSEALNPRTLPPVFNVANLYWRDAL